MAETSPNLALPYIQPSQAQKHVTHNEALRLLDAVAQLVVQDRTLTAPPAAPDPGQRHIVAPGGTGLWAGHDAEIAVFEDGGWFFVVPQAGWVAQVLADGQGVIFDGTGWARYPLDFDNLPGVGINTTSDSTNRLSVSAQATLLNHAGAGHQLKINKALPGDTASLLFQTGFSGRAEMGLAGDDSFSVKVSADGTAWSAALGTDSSTGRVSLPAGVTVTGTITGTAVTQGPTDATADRLLKTGDAGWLGLAPNVAVGDTWAALGQSQIIAAPAIANQPTDRPTGFNGHPFVGLHLMQTATRWAELAIGTGGTAVDRAFLRSSDAGLTTAWDMLFSRRTILGTVSQTSGVPTGAVVQRGSNANGSFVRFADGTQICTHALTMLYDDIFVMRVTWTYPAVFAVAPAVQHMPDLASAVNYAAVRSQRVNWGATTALVVGASSAILDFYRISGAPNIPTTATIGTVATAIGRWF